MEYSKVKNMILGQSALEISIAIMIGVLLIAGAISVWNHFSKIKVDRMDEYRSTRYAAVNPTVATTGQQLAYRETPLDIFSLINTVGSAPPVPGPGPNTTSSCFPDYNASMNLSGTLIQEAAGAEISLGWKISDSMTIRTAFSQLGIWLASIYLGWFRPLPPASPLITWLYGQNNAGRLFKRDWDRIGIDFDNQVQNYLNSPYYTNIQFDENMGTCDPRSGWWCFNRQKVWDNYITPGLNVELLGERDAYITIIKNNLSVLVLKVGEAKYNACERSFQGQNTACDTQCGSYLTQAETEINNSLNYLGIGQYSQSWASWQLAKTLLNDYRTCFINCAGTTPWYEDPCYMRCKAEFDAFEAKNIEVTLALGEGRLGDSETLGDEAETLHDAYNACYQAAVAGGCRP